METVSILPDPDYAPDTATRFIVAAINALTIEVAELRAVLGSDAHTEQKGAGE